MRMIVGTVLVAALAVFPFAQTGRKVVGFVYSASTGRPIAGAHVQYDDENLRQTTTTDAKGAFELPGPANRGVVTITAGKYGTQRKAWPPYAGSTLDVFLRAPATLTGSVLDAVNRRPVARGMATLLVRSETGIVSSSDSIRGGSFEIDDLPPGPALLIARGEGYAPSASTLTIDAGRRSSVQVRLLLEASLSGTVQDSRGLPVDDAELYVRYPNEAVEEMLAGMVNSAAGAEPGSFRLYGLVPDTQMEVHAELDGRQSPAVSARVGPGMEQTGVVLRFP